MIGIAIIPALYNLSFLTAMWDPYGNIKDLPVAVVNQDKPSTLGDKLLTIGDDMVQSMKDEASLDFHFVSAEKGAEGLKKGDYYMVITLPEDLSEGAASLLTENPKQVEISYETSKGHSFVASKMSESAMEKMKNSISEKITKKYTSAVFDSMSHLQTGLVAASEGGQQLESGAEKLEGGAVTLTTNLSTLYDSTQTLSKGTNTLYSGLTLYTSGVQQLDSGLNQFSDGLTNYTAAVGKLANGGSQLEENSSKLVAAMSQLQAGVGQMQPLMDGVHQLTAGLQELEGATSLSDQEVQQINGLVSGLEQLQAGITQLDSQVTGLSGGDIPTIDAGAIVSQVESLTAQAQAIETATQTEKEANIAALQATTTYKGLPADQQAELVSAIADSPSAVSEYGQSIRNAAEAISQNMSGLQTNVQTLQEASTRFKELQGAVNQITEKTNQVLPATNTIINQLSSGLNQVSGALQGQLIPASSQVASGMTSIQNGLSAGTEQLVDKTIAYTEAVGKLSGGAQQLEQNNSALKSGLGALQTGTRQLTTSSPQLLGGASQLSNGSERLSDGAGQLQAGEQTLTDGIGQLSTGIVDLTTSLGRASQQLSLVSVKDNNAELVSAPISTSHSDKDSVDTNGIGMAPYMISVSLMVAALSTNVIFAKSLDGKDYDNRWSWAKGKLVLNGLISTVAASILYIIVGEIGVLPNHPLETFIMIILTSWTLMALVTALVGWDSKYGAFVSLILLLLQLGSSAGTYPIELSPKFFQFVQPFLPMTYSVSGLRQTISMKGQIGVQVIILLAFLLMFLVLGLIGFKKEEVNKK